MKLKTFLSWTFVILTLGFLFYALYTNWQELQTYTFSLSWRTFLFSYLFLFVHFVLVAVAWALLVRALKKPGIPIIQAVRIRTISDFARFVPGKIWLIVARVQLSKKFNIPAEIIAVSALMEEYLNVFSTLLVFIAVFFLVTHETLTRYAWYLFFLLPIPFLLLHPRFFQPFLTYVAKLLKRPSLRFHVEYGYLLSLLSVFFVAWVILGIGFYLMATSVYPLALSSLLPLMGVFAISWAAGFLIIFLPGGLGWREAVLSYLLSFFIPLPIAIILSLLSRVWLVSGEAVTAFVFRFVK